MGGESLAFFRDRDCEMDRSMRRAECEGFVIYEGGCRDFIDGERFVPHHEGGGVRGLMGRIRYVPDRVSGAVLCEGLGIVGRLG